MMRVSLLMVGILFQLFPLAWGQEVEFGPKTLLLGGLDLEYADDSYVAGDFDGDGDIDLAGLHSGVLLMFQNQGDFSFDTIEMPDAIFEVVRDVADMNADGIDDLITSDAYYTHDADQAFTRHELNLGDFRLVRMARDINLDGYADIIAEFDDYSGEPVMYWYRNNADTSFTERLIDSQESEYDYVTVADYNLDGRLDIIIVNAENNRFLVFRQGTSGSFTRVVIPVSTNVLDGGVGVVDIDSDGDVDFISGAPYDFEESLYYLENKSLSFTTRHPIAGLMDIYSLETGDLDGDGDQDLVFIDRLSGYRVGYFVNQGVDNWSEPVILGYFSSFGTFAYQNLNLFDTWLHLKDIDADGKKDIVVSAIPNDQVFWFKNETLFTGTEHVSNSPTIFYPQPASDYVRVEDLPFERGVLTMFDSYGQQVMTINIQNQDVIDLVNLPAGLFYYLVSSHEKHQLLSGKIMKLTH